MASTSSSSTSVSTHHEYDVFLSFRGEDTSNSFTDHLYKALRQAGIRTFRDDDEIHEGQELKPKIKRSIRKSRASVIVFSDNFANSRWCLDELWLILRQKRKGCHFVLPVFYGVDPSDVRNQRGSFTVETKEGAEDSKWTEDNVKRWKASLREVANLKGMVVSGNDMIDVWRSRMNSLNSLEGDLDRKIQDVLQKSFESLPCDNHKELFLHIACFFVGEYASHVEIILENDYHAKFGIVTLINRCLLTHSRNCLRLTMHKLLQDMARKIVRNECKMLLGSEKIEGLIFNVLKFKEEKRLERFVIIVFFINFKQLLN
ncbi:hypothetical protein L1987_54152 [Smallanthus sonchifolius]|uniref:Uncharacterized protein n=1 Tax=Smallanthus sonchifolius TaxID=185202 RepID=A0ACB9E6T0_9ASTR|nr:hypothetical protein L1987_54152 [Smallanthus sonchifolius]